MRPNKTHFGLSFGHFGGSYVKGKEEDKEEKKKRKTRKVWIHDFEYGTRTLYGNFEYGSVCMDISGSISRV